MGSTGDLKLELPLSALLLGLLVLVGVTTEASGCWCQCFLCAAAVCPGDQEVPFPKPIKVALSEQKISTSNGEAGLVCAVSRRGVKDCCWVCAECCSPCSRHRACCRLCRWGRRLQCRGFAFEAVRSNGVGTGNLLASGLVFFLSLEGVFHVQKRERREGKEEFCPTRLQPLSLSALLHSFSSSQLLQ